MRNMNEISDPRKSLFSLYMKKTMGCYFQKPFMKYLHSRRRHQRALCPFPSHLQHSFISSLTHPEAMPRWAAATMGPPILARICSPLTILSSEVKWVHWTGTGWASPSGSSTRLSFSTCLDRTRTVLAFSLCICWNPSCLKSDFFFRKGVSQSPPPPKKRLYNKVYSLSGIKDTLPSKSFRYLTTAQFSRP